jgi:hypothetical protein
VPSLRCVNQPSSNPGSHPAQFSERVPIVRRYFCRDDTEIGMATGFETEKRRALLLAAGPKPIVGGRA